MIEYGLPVIFALFVWWFSTGVIIYLDGLPRHTFRWGMLGATLLLAASIYGLAVTKNDTSVAGAYWAFTFGLLIWGWQEISFYMGFVTGPRKKACPEGCRGWKHFGHAIQVSLYHELSIIAAAVLVVAVTWNGANQVGTWTFMILWWMHESARLNVFLGVRNLNEEFLPEHLEYLKGFLTKKPMNLLFPVSITVSTVILTWLVQLAIAPEATAFEAVGYTFLATMMALAVLEHWFLVVPLPAASLWNWALSSHGKAQPLDGEPAAFGVVEDHSFKQVSTLSALHLAGSRDTETDHGHDHEGEATSSHGGNALGENEQPRIVAIGQNLDCPALDAGTAGCTAAATTATSGPTPRTRPVEPQSEEETKNGLPELLRPAAY